MKRVLLAAGVALALAAVPAAAQTRVSVFVGFGVPRPVVTRVYYASAPVVVVGPHRRYFHRRPVIVVHRRPVIVVRRVPVARHRHHHHHWDYEDD